MAMIDTVLVANRGEIARRIFRTCRELGLSTVAVYSDADAREPHALEADAAVRLPGTATADTYLRADLLIAAAIKAEADAVHPGYGFLSENADFARKVIEAGLTWIGPPPDAIASMGSKIEAKRIMAAAGVPVLTEIAEPSEHDLPLLIKASAGGGGRGMRVVRHLGDLGEALEAARSEAASAFGDPAVFCEPYLETGHHVEVQILADTHGTVWAVGERECSIQRRHQKVVEEAPSPLVERLPELREPLYAAARVAAEAIGYVGAGTVEFLAGDDGRFFFLETNTRLQVEHPVTELTTGLDLVAWQLAIAAGDKLPPRPPAAVGHAIEVRLYAEDPARDWQPQSGTLHRLSIPATEGIRVDSGVADGSVVGVHYDPMIAKVIAWAPERTHAARLLASTLAHSSIHGLTTNRDLLVNVLKHEQFLAGNTDTAFLAEHDVTDPLADDRAVDLSALAAALAEAAYRRETATVQRGLPSGWRNLASGPQTRRYRAGDREIRVDYRLTRDGLVADSNVKLLEATPDRVALDVDGVTRMFAIARYPGLVCVDSALGPVSLRPIERFADPAEQLAAGSLLAPMPGTVVRVAVRPGESVTAGQSLMWLEAMKMEHTITAPADGIVAELPVEAGVQVEIGAVLVVLKEGEA